ncbi:uncharacterized protein G6M90_00g031510 [Metarhizium brunneum]|uniref:Uncharacterized protein n=1 Tax=Metarhizium brunneum TaxID=500148 RepID=A0A7D5Z4C6_9HYPO
MCFLKGAFTFAAFSALAASILGVPLETSTIVDYDKGDLARHAVDVGGLDEHLADLSLPIDARHDSRLVERQVQTPPTRKDMKVYLVNLEKQPAYSGCTQKLVFWSGVTEGQARSFATKNKRFTGDVYGYFTERAVEQKDLKECQVVWCRIEKSIVVQSRKGKQVTSVAKYVLYKDRSTKHGGLIKTIAA